MTFSESVEKLKKEILGKDYELSLAFVSSEKSRSLNKKYRKKNKPTNVLSFSLTKNSGELILCRDVIKKEAAKLGKSAPSWTGFLVIHGLLHLKGLDHSAKMERLETAYDQKYFHRNRSRNRNDKNSRRRISGKRTNSKNNRSRRSAK